MDPEGHALLRATAVDSVAIDIPPPYVVASGTDECIEIEECQQTLSKEERVKLQREVTVFLENVRQREEAGGLTTDLKEGFYHVDDTPRHFVDTEEIVDHHRMNVFPHSRHLISLASSKREEVIVPGIMGKRRRKRKKDPLRRKGKRPSMAPSLPLMPEEDEDYIQFEAFSDASEVSDMDDSVIDHQSEPDLVDLMSQEDVEPAGIYPKSSSDTQPAVAVGTTPPPTGHQFVDLEGSHLQAFHETAQDAGGGRDDHPLVGGGWNPPSSVAEGMGANVDQSQDPQPKLNFLYYLSPASEAEDALGEGLDAMAAKVVSTLGEKERIHSMPNQSAFFMGDAPSPDPAKFCKSRTFVPGLPDCVPGLPDTRDLPTRPTSISLGSTVSHEGGDSTEDESPGVKASVQHPRVKFLLGAEESSEELSTMVHAKTAPEIKVPKKKRHTLHIPTEKELASRRRRGSEVRLKGTRYNKPDSSLKRDSSFTQQDLDDLSAHRFYDPRGLQRRRASPGPSMSHPALSTLPSQITKDKFDHQPHELFIQLDELQLFNDELQWKERARWIKYEEDVEEGVGRWGKPHVPSLSFHSLLELRNCINQGSVILDLEADDMEEIANYLVNTLVEEDQLGEDKRDLMLDLILLRHKHLRENRSTFLQRSSTAWMLGLDHLKRRSMTDIHTAATSPGTTRAGVKYLSASHGSDNMFNRNQSASPPERSDVPTNGHANGDGTEVPPIAIKPEISYDLEPAHKSPRPPKYAPTGSPPMSPRQGVPIHTGHLGHYSESKSSIVKRIPKGAETTSVLVGTLEELDEPVMAFVRLAAGTYVEGLTEVSLPVRFIFLLMGPSTACMNYYEIGRSIATLLANKKFHRVAYQADDRKDLLGALNEFLNDTLVLPPSDVDRKTLLPIIEDMKRKAAEKRRKKREKAKLLIKEGDETKDETKPKDDPLQRTGRLFGGLINDIKRRYPKYLSDITDALDFQIIAVCIFIYFACLSPAITFGGLMGQKTDNWMGVTEMLFITFVCGIIMHLFAGQPLIIVGATGPVVVFEVALYEISNNVGLDFMAFRFWVCIWIAVICTILVAFEGSFLVRYFTRFTEEIFASLISVIFIYEVFAYLFHTFEKYPMAVHNDDLPAISAPENLMNITDGPVLSLNTLTDALWSTVPYVGNLLDVTTTPHIPQTPKGDPNTALLSMMLTFGTFLLAFFLKKLRNSKFLGRPVRRAIGDFGVPLAIVVMVLIDYFIIQDSYTEKLSVPDGLTPTKAGERVWLINPSGVQTSLPVWAMLAAAIPAILVFILLFMETQITSIIVNKKERKLVKGSGYHLDMFIMGLFATISGIIGCPLVCAAPIRAVTHVSSLTVYSRTHAPGEKPSIVKVKEQRISGLVVHILIGVSTLLGPLLREIPLPVLFGVFLYMGVASINGIQLMDRLELLLVPVKHHPNVGYVRRVRTAKMHLFTIIQLVCFAILWVVKSTKASLAFPFLLILLVPFRRFILPFLFTQQELDQLDKPEETPETITEEEEIAEETDDEPDFYSQTHMPV